MTAAIKIAVVGGPNSGKSSLITRFIKNEFQTHAPSAKCHACVQFGRNGLRAFSSATRENDSRADLPDSLIRFYRKKIRCACHRQRPVIRTVAYKGLDGRTQLADLLLMDVPALTPFPQDTQQEFDVEGARGVTRASAYIILFDVTKMESYGFMSRIRLEIQDFLRNSTAEVLTPRGNEEEETTATCGTSLRWSLRRNKEKPPPVGPALSPPMPSTSSNDANSKCVEPVIVIVGTKVDLYSNHRKDESELLWYKEALHTIKKSWKHPYVACSAKRGYRVDEVFSTTVNAVLVARGLRKKPKAKKRRAKD